MSEHHLSAATLEAVDAEVRHLVGEAERTAAALLNRHRGRLDALADALIEHESLNAAEITAVLQQAGTPKKNGNGRGQRKSAAAASV